MPMNVTSNATLLIILASKNPALKRPRCHGGGVFGPTLKIGKVLAKWHASNANAFVLDFDIPVVELPPVYNHHVLAGLRVALWVRMRPGMLRKWWWVRLRNLTRLVGLMLWNLLVLYWRWGCRLMLGRVGARSPKLLVL